MAVYSTLGQVAGGSSFTITWTGTQPTPGNKIAVVFWGSNSSNNTVSSVKDNASSQNTFTAGPSVAPTSDRQLWLYWLDLPTNASWSGNYTVTVTFSASITDASGGGGAYPNVTSGAPAATNTNSGTGTSATSGAANPGASSSLYVAGVNDNTGSNPASPFSVAAPFTMEVTQLNGSSQQAGSMADAVGSSGSQNATFTIQNNTWSALIAAWTLIPVSTAGSAIGGGWHPGAGPTNARFFQRLGAFPSSAGPVVNVVTASDTLSALSDAATRALQASLRTASDTLGSLTDVATRAAQSAARTAADSLSALSDAATRAAQASSRTATDSLAALTDAATRTIQAKTRSATDSLSALSDSASRSLQSFARTATETIAALTDQAFKAGSHITVTASDTLSSLSETVARAAQQSARTSSDVLSALVEVATRAAQHPVRTAVQGLSALVDAAVTLGANTGQPVPGPTRLLGAAVNRLLGMVGRNRMSGGGPNQLGG
jgi:hypothetical protein